ncbi:MAG: outer membrane beta-barrel protein, partial [Acidobacteriota bacterium]
LLLACLSTAAGQSYESFQNEVDNIAENRSRFKFGPFRLYPLIRLTDFGYDGNVFRGQWDRDPVTDFTVTLSPSLDVNVLYHNWLILSLSESPEYIHYFKVSRERAWNNTIAPRIKMLLFNRFVLEAGYSYGKRRRRGTSEFDIRADERSENFRLRLFYETPRKTMFGLSGGVHHIKWEDADLPEEDIYYSRQLNRTERNAAFEFYYQLFSRSHFYLTFNYTDYRFMDIASWWRNSVSYQVNAGLRFPLLGRMTGSVFVGYKELLPNIRETPGFSGLVGGSTVDYRVGRFAFGLGYTRDSQFSYSTTNIYFITDQYRPRVSFYLARSIKLTYSFSYGENRYPEPESFRLEDGTIDYIKRRDIYKTHSAGFAVRLVGRTGVGISLSWWQVDSNFYTRGARSQFFVGAYLTQDF